MSRDAEASSRAEEDGVQRLERLLHESGALLHPQHAAVIDIKTQLAKIYGNYAPYQLPSLPRPLKERKIQVSRDRLDISFMESPLIVCNEDSCSSCAKTCWT